MAYVTVSRKNIPRENGDRIKCSPLGLQREEWQLAVGAEVGETMVVEPELLLCSETFHEQLGSGVLGLVLQARELVVGTSSETQVGRSIDTTVIGVFLLLFFVCV